MNYEDVMNLAQRRGYLIRSAEAYPNTPAGFWDYGPLGVSLRNRYVEMWRKSIVKRDEMIEIDAAQIMPRSVFEASGHISNFTDPVVVCGKCRSLYRPDKLIEEKLGRATPENLPDAKYDELLKEHGIRCAKCGTPLSGTKRFNMMFKVGVGPQGDEAYLRPETCQGIFADIPFLFKTQRVKLPKGFAQVGKSFRNEIAPRQGVLRLREILQAEIEVCFDPEATATPRFDVAADYELSIAKGDVEPVPTRVSDAISAGTVPNKLVGYYLYLIQSFYEDAVGLKKEEIRLRTLTDVEKAFYSKVAYDLEVRTSVGWLELVACNYRSDYDLKRHSEVSGTDYTVEVDGRKVLPHIFELSMGVDRSLYVILERAYRSEKDAKGGDRVYLSLRPGLAPILAGVFPLVSKDGLDVEAERIYEELRADYDLFYDESGSIGRRYARADEAGVPFCVTVDQDTLTKGEVTVRSRDDRAQVRVKTDELGDWLEAKLVSG
ncbi:MAG: glycine--tRNA ligase [Nitrososphaerota archaeon]|nr:glycine--tRNA ligase [Nitrososphaerota archaeon]